MAAFDFIIVGAGIAGASLACHLSREGGVLVLERESQPGYHTTGRSAATFSPGYAHGPVAGLTRASEDFYSNPPDGFAESPILLARGSLSVAGADKTERLARDFEALCGTNPRLQRLEGKALAELAPVLRPEAASLGIYDPDMKDMDVAILHQAYLRAARRNGALVRTGALAVPRRDGLWRVRTENEIFEAPILINAAGAWADEFAASAGARTIGLVPKRRTVITFDVPPGTSLRDLPCVVEIDRDWYFKPDAGRFLASPADETPSPPCDVQPEEYDVAVIMERMRAVLAFPVARPEARWAGLRSFVSDNLPVIGWAPDAPGFFWLAGQGGHGIQSAEGAARLAASLILDLPLPADLREMGIDAAALSPNRPGLR